MIRIKLTENFYLDEFIKEDNAIITIDVLNNLIEVANNMQEIRNVLKTSITVNSGYRSIVYNKSIGGAKYSQHLLGCACDFTAKGYTPDEVSEVVEALMEGNLIINGGLGRYDTFTHYDIRNSVSRWDNR